MNKNKIAIIVLAALLLITGGFLYKTLDEMKNIKKKCCFGKSENETQYQKF